MRYAWDQQTQYLRQAGLDRGLMSICARSCLHFLRGWDLNAASRVDYFIANSYFISKRISKVYRRDSTVVYPPVDVEAFCPGEKPGDTYLAVSRFVPYKRVDLIVQAFAAMPDRRLLVVGTGPKSKRIVEAARGASNIEFVETLPREQLLLALQRARAFVFAGEEDFGITLVEAQACGTPVIAFARGGAAEIVRDDLTGVLFSEQTVTSVIEGVNRFEAIENKLCRTACTNNATRFRVERFRRELCDAVDFAFRARSGSRLGPPKSRSDLIDLGRDGSVAHRLARRANALVLSDDGMSCGEVAKVLLWDDGTVRTWYRLHEDEGIEGLASFGYDGSACRLSDAQQDKLRTWIAETLPRTTERLAPGSRPNAASPMRAALG